MTEATYLTTGIVDFKFSLSDSEKQLVRTRGNLHTHSDDLLVFMLQAISGQWAFPVPRINISIPCQLSDAYLEIPTTLAVFMYAIPLLFMLFMDRRST